MSELDLGLKVGSRRLLWNMGFSTRLDVELRGDHTTPTARPSRGSRGPETFTDLDVLGIVVSPGYRLTSVIADCKTSRRDSTARMFWLRGVADFFGADRSFLVREQDVTDAARQLASRLDITVLPSADLTQMQSLHADTFDPRGPLGMLFDREHVAHHLAAFNGLDKRLGPLLDYRQFDYWVIDEYRNLQRLVRHLSSAKAILDPRNPIHVALFLDLAWMYLLTLIHATVYIRSAYLNDVDRGAREYLFGGAAGLHEKQSLAERLRAMAPAEISPEELDHLPVYYSRLRELLVRLLRRPGHVQSALRQLEVATALGLEKSSATSTSVLMGGAEDDLIAAKLAADVCGFLVATCDLDSEFRVKARSLLLGEIPPAQPVQSLTVPISTPADTQLTFPEND